MKSLFITLLTLFSVTIFADNYKPMDGYSKEPLQEPIFENIKVIIDSVSFNNWLNDNYSKLNAETMKGPREHLYYLISSYVSELNKKDGIILPKENDLVLANMLSWAERLGAYGAHLFFNKVKNANARNMPPLLKVSKGIELSAVNDMFLVEAANGAWSIKFPYYFMIGALSEFTATNGMATQLVTISTGGVKDKSPAGKSQATLMFAYSTTENLAEFKDYWLTLFAMSTASATKPLGIKQLESFNSYDKKALLHKEITFLPTAQGSLLVAYLGVDGAYEINRVHFLDFLSQVKTATLAD